MKVDIDTEDYAKSYVKKLLLMPGNYTIKVDGKIEIKNPIYLESQLCSVEKTFLQIQIYNLKENYA